MNELLFQISPDLVNSTSKICSPTAFNNKYLVFVVDSTTIKLVAYENQALSAHAVLNAPHQGEQVKCLKLSHADLSPPRLLSCGPVDVALWTVDELFKTNSPSGSRLGSRAWFRSEINECAFHSSNKIVGIACVQSILVIDVSSNTLLDEIELNNSACVNLFEFSLFHSNLVFVSVETNLVVSYDFRLRKPLQELSDDHLEASSLRSSIAFVDICGLENEPLVLLGSTNGLLHLYQYINGRFMSLRRIEVKKFGFECDGEETVCIGLDLFSIGPNPNDQKFIACASLNRIYVIDLYSGNLINSFRHYFDSKSNNSHDRSIPQRVDFCLSAHNELFASVLYVFKNEINVIKLMDVSPFGANKVETAVIQTGDIKTRQKQVVEDDLVLTVFPKLSLLEDSPLNDEIKISGEKKSSKILSMQDYLKKTNPSLRKEQSLDKPLTFNSRIKSSGYNSVSTSKRFQPVINRSATTLALSKLDMNKKETTSLKSSSSSFNLKEFRFHLPTNLKSKFAATDRSSPIIDLKFSNDGQHFALVSNDNLIQFASASNPEKAGLSLSSHQDTINSIDISHNGKYLVSASRDKTCKVWSTGSGKVLIDIKSLVDESTTSLSSSLSSSSSSGKSQSMPTSFEFKKEPTCAQFFYLDKFMLIGCDKSLLLCKYHIDTTKNEIQRYVNNSTCRLVTRLPLTFSQQSISCLSGINSFYSYLVLCAGSNKDIEVFDLNESKSCLTIHDAHTRPITQLVQNASEFNKASYDLFASNSVCDGVKLWDLRTSSCVARLDVHLNRYLATKCSFSPDSCYLAVGSEDRTVAVYDLRMIPTSTSNSEVMTKKYGIFSDSVSCALFNPKRSQLLCATLDGRLFNYQD